MAICLTESALWAYETVDQLRGHLSQRLVPDPAAFERANYIETLASHPTPGPRR